MEFYSQELGLKVQHSLQASQPFHQYNTFENTVYNSGNRALLTSEQLRIT